MRIIANPAQWIFVNPVVQWSFANPVQKFDYEASIMLQLPSLLEVDGKTWILLILEVQSGCAIMSNTEVQPFAQGFSTRHYTFSEPCNSTVVFYHEKLARTLRHLYD